MWHVPAVRSPQACGLQQQGTVFSQVVCNSSGALFFGCSSRSQADFKSTAVTRDLLAPIPFREVFAILALFLPQLPFAEGARVDN